MGGGVVDKGRRCCEVALLFPDLDFRPISSTANRAVGGYPLGIKVDMSNETEINSATSSKIGRAHV